MGKDYCAIAQCHNFSGKVGRYDKIVRLHSLPKDKTLRSAWIRAISRKNYSPTNNTFVCSDHFPGGDGRSWKHKVPTLHLPQKTPRDMNVRSTKNSNRSQDTEIMEENESCLPNESFTKSDESLLNLSRVFHSYHYSASSGEEQGLCSNNDQQVQSSKSQTEISTRSSEVQTDVRPEIRMSCISDEDVPFYTGLPNRATFYALLDTCINHGIEKHICERSALTLEDSFFLTLMRLRLGLLQRDLAYRFKVSESSVSRIFNSWLTYLYPALKSTVFIPKCKPEEEYVPECFHKFPDTKIVLDCTEIFIETPSSLDNKSKVYSNYKSHSTFKALIGINKTGAVTLVSKLYGGCTSDVEITRNCGLYDQLIAGDAVMADKGFVNIKPDLVKLGMKLYVPPLNTNQQLSKEGVTLTRRIASARIHVERKMEQIKNFRILHGVIPLSLSNSINEIFFICSALTNFLPPLVK